MRAALETPYADSRAAALGWRLGEPGQRALAGLVVPVPGGEVELNLLGSSHHVRASVERPAGRPPVVCSEVVACSAGKGRLPAAARRTGPGFRYRFASRVELLGRDELEDRAGRLARSVEERPDALVGVFPGSPHAVTALVAEPGDEAGEVRWRSWHVYPNSGEIVSTTSVMSWR